MAAATPSRPGDTETGGRMEINVFDGEAIVRKTDGRLVRRQVSQLGTVREDEVFPGDFEGQEGIDIIPEAELDLKTNKRKTTKKESK